MPSIALSNLSARKGRSTISILTVALGTALFLLLVGFTQGTLREIASRMIQTDADLIVMHKGANPLITTNMSNLPMALGGELRNLPGVAGAVPVAMTSVVIHNQATRMYGIAAEDLKELLKGRKFLSGRMYSDTLEAVIDNRLASVESLGLGDYIAGPAETQFKIVGIVEAGVLGRIYVPIGQLQNTLREPETVWAFLVKCREPREAANVAAQVESRFKLAGTVMVANYFEVLSKSLKEMQYVVRGVVVLTLIMSFMVILLGMYTSVVERTREIGILKAIGAGKRLIVGEIMLESVIVAILGATCGIGLSFLGRIFIERSYPHYSVDLTARWLALSVLLGLVAGVCGSALPAWKAARQDPVTALNYE